MDDTTVGTTAPATAAPTATSTAPPSSAGTTTLRLDAHAVTVLAHPLRTRILSALRLDGAATATQLAQRLETNTGATSYHLRRLATVGLVEETPDGGGRQRFWQPTSQAHAFYASDVDDSPDARAALSWLHQTYQHEYEQRAATWHAQALELSLAWQDAGGTTDRVLELDAASTTSLMADLAAVLDRYQGRAASSSDDARRVFVVLSAFPETGFHETGDVQPIPPAPSRAPRSTQP